MTAAGFAGGERMLYAAIGTSIVVHALMMTYWPKFEPPAPAPPPPIILATLRATPAPAAVPVPAQAATPKPPKPEMAVEKTPPPLPAPSSSPAITPPPPRLAEVPIAKSAVPVSGEVAAPAPAPPPAAALPAAAAAPSAAPAAVSVAEAPKGAAPGGSGDPSEKNLIGGYQHQLAQMAEKYKRYPIEARDNNWEGIATVRLKIGVDGKIAGVEISRSSGHEILDEQASIMVSRAVPFLQIPAGLKGKEFVAVIQIGFKLKS